MWSRYHKLGILYQMRRIQRAAEYHQAAVFLIRPADAESEAAAADLRVYVSTHSQQIELEILHSRCQPGTCLRLDTQDHKPLFARQYYAQPQRLARHHANHSGKGRMQHLN